MPFDPNGAGDSDAGAFRGFPAQRAADVEDPEAQDNQPATDAVGDREIKVFIECTFLLTFG